MTRELSRIMTQYYANSGSTSVQSICLHEQLIACDWLDLEAGPRYYYVRASSIAHHVTFLTRTVDSVIIEHLQNLHDYSDKVYYYYFFERNFENYASLNKWICFYWKWLSKDAPGKGLAKIGNALVWKFGKEEVASMLTRAERLKSLVWVALLNDHLYFRRAKWKFGSHNPAIRNDVSFFPEPKYPDCEMVSMGFKSALRKSSEIKTTECITCSWSGYPRLTSPLKSPI